jgi:hypothetical protein
MDISDWTDELLLQYAGTNEAVDAEIENRGLNGGTAGAISEPYEDATTPEDSNKFWENYLWNQNMTKDFNQYFGGSQGEDINKYRYPSQGRTLRTPIRDTIASTGVDYPWADYRKNMNVVRDIQEGQSIDRFFGNTTAALQEQWRDYQDQGGKLEQAVNRFETPTEDYDTFRAQVGEQPTGGGGFERGDYGGRGFHWSRGGYVHPSEKEIKKFVYGKLKKAGWLY